jgi:hypothetical protein
MQNPQGFDYNQPSLDALAGIYVEASDSATEKSAAEVKSAPRGAVGPAEAERLFGLTMTVDDESAAERLSRTPPAG